MTRKRVYLSGPISNGGNGSVNSQKANMAAAAVVAQRLMEAGYAVLCPHLTVHQEELTGIYNDHSVWIENDLPWVEAADLVVRMPGASVGADRECAFAKENGIPVYSVEQALWKTFVLQKQGSTEVSPSPENPASESCPTCVERIAYETGHQPITKADKAKELVYGAREKSYGHPYEDFHRTAMIWGAILGGKVEPWQVALMMVGLKLSREVNKPGEDNIIDAHGYLLTYDRVLERQARG